METQKMQVQGDIEIARTLASEGRIKDAAEMVEGLLKSKPGMGEASALLCRFYMQMNRQRIPKEMILNGLSEDPALGIELIEYASLISENSAFKESNDILEALVWSNPNNFEAWNDLGAVRFAMDDVVTAEMAFNQALALHPGYGESLLNLAALFLETNRVEQAVVIAKNANHADCDATREMLAQLAELIRPFDSEVAAALLSDSTKATV